MQIKRIKEIINIGTFANFTNGGSSGFEKLTFVYGLNTFGKTTLADILQSLQTNDSSLILNRKTIPEITSSQKVKLSTRRYGENETDVTFAGNQWSPTSISKYLDVFGTDFIHSNVFTGLTIDRKNKENLTNFILGDQGVQLAEKIGEKKKFLGEKKKIFKDKVPQYIKLSPDEEIKKFLSYDISKLNLENIDQELTQAKLLLQKEQDRLKEPTKITNLSEPTEYTPQKNNYSDAINSINTLLEKNYSDIKEESIAKLNEHILNNFSSSDNAKNWIHQGLGYCKDKNDGNCPFCDQNLKNAKELIDLYSNYFDKAYTDFVNETNSGLNIGYNLLKDDRLNNFSSLQSILLIINQYKDYIQNETFLKNLDSLTSLVNNLNEEGIEKEKNRITTLLENKIEEKNKSPYDKIESVDRSLIDNMINEYTKKVNKCSVLIDYFIREIKLFKKQYQSTTAIEKKIEEIKNDISKLEYKKARIEQDQECRECNKLSNEIDKLENGDEGIIQLEKKLQKEQTEFLKKYFTEINKLFLTFGSKNFTLEKDEDRRGHLPVYSLVVKFHEKEIPADKLYSVFSESDRRALALAIFFARFELKSDTDKKRSIIVLDDPVTSFDDNRTINSINYFKKILSASSQVIILTHYLHFIKRFCEITKEDLTNTVFISINQNNYTSFLEQANKEDLISSDYDKTFMKIYDYINKKRSESIKADLRPFLESMYFPTVFCKQIQDKQVDCCNLKSIINGLFDDNEEVKNKFHEFRITLNPESHLFTNSNEEDVRNFANEMFEFMYSLDFSVNN
ncbi:AAA family ATPase [Patescibacteria group bacterium]|nr:AAA family ATPase [Patescibacteria group bacterium]